MGFFQTFWSWLNAVLAGYIGTNTARVAAVLEPPIVAAATVYVLVWGYLMMAGRIEDPLLAGLKRILTVALVLGVAIHLWLYNAVIVNSFYQAPAEFAAAVLGATDPVKSIDAIWERGGTVAEVLWTVGSSQSIVGAAGYYIVGAVIWILIGMLCIYTMFLIAMASIASAVLLALGPFFVAMLLFEGTRSWFWAWIGQLANYALVTVLTVLVAALLLQLVQSYCTQTAALGPNLKLVDSLNMLLMAMLVFLFMRQVLPIAAALAGGASLTTFNATSRLGAYGLRSLTSSEGAKVARARAAHFVSELALSIPKGAQSLIRERLGHTVPRHEGGVPSTIQEEPTSHA